MSAGAAAKLYTPEVLGLATRLAAYPLTDDLTSVSEVRSRTCGSTLIMGVEIDADGALERLGMRVSACAIGQAAAAIFAGDALGRTHADMERASLAIENWLAGEGEKPDWRGISVLDPVRAHPARHGAIMLAWRAAIEVLPKISD